MGGNFQREVPKQTEAASQNVMSTVRYMVDPLTPLLEIYVYVVDLV